MRLKIIDLWPGENPKQIYLKSLIDRDIINVIFCDDNPDVIISFGFGEDYKKYGCIRIQHMTNEAWIKMNTNEFDYFIGYPDIPIDRSKYCYIPFAITHIIELNNMGYTIPDISMDQIRKRKFCCFLGQVDNRIYRKQMIQNISLYKKIDTVTGDWNNMHKLVNDHGTISKINWISDYKFNITPENTVKRGYITEKAVDAFIAGTIPIWSGDIDTFNHDFILDKNLIFNGRNLDIVIETMKYYDRNDVQYFKLVHENHFVHTDIIEYYRNKFSLFLKSIESRL